MIYITPHIVLFTRIGPYVTDVVPILDVDQLFVDWGPTLF